MDRVTKIINVTQSISFFFNKVALSSIYISNSGINWKFHEPFKAQLWVSRYEKTNLLPPVPTRSNLNDILGSFPLPHSINYDT